MKHDSTQVVFKYGEIECSISGPERFVSEHYPKVLIKLLNLKNMPKTSLERTGNAPKRVSNNNRTIRKSFIGRGYPKKVIEHQKLSDFFQTHSGAKSYSDYSLLFGYYLIKELGMKEFSVAHIEICYGILKLKRPLSVVSTLYNAKNSKHWVARTETKDGWTITHSGAQHVQSGSFTNSGPSR